MRKMINLKTYLLISVVLVTLWTAAASADVIYVDAGAATGGDGSTWTKAYIYLQDALNDPCLAIGDEIWVAAETYKPDTSSAYPGGTGSRYATFYLGYGVALYGGFPAGGGDWEQRDPGTNETILSGDIGMWLNNQDNSFHVVTGNGVNPTAILDGFTITAGNAHSSYYYEDRGGGMYNYNYSNPTVINCTFRGNSAYRYGGGIYNEYSNPTVINCTFSGNSAIYGGGMCNYDHSNPMVINCIFSGNSAGKGGGMYNNFLSNPTVTDCTFSCNSADWIGGGMYTYAGSPMLINCILWGNTAPEPNGPQIANLTNYALSISYSDLQGGQAAIYDPCGALVWGAGNIDADPLFIDSDGPDNIVGTPDDNLRLSSSSPCIDAGNNTAVPPDSSDLDGDGNIAERTPFDLEGNNRFVDDPGTPDSGYGAPPVVDMGAYEYQITGYLLTVSSNSGGSVTAPGEGIFEYEYGEVVSIVAEADEHYQFVEWTGTAVDAGKVANPVAESTTVTMTSGYTLAANFAEVGVVIYVDIDADGANNGTCWMDAYTDLQSALTTSFSVDQIWVAEGTYKPTVTTPPPPPSSIVGYSSSKDIAVTAGGRMATFQLINGVSIYGGFPSGGGAWGDRNPDAFETILSGDIFGDDMPNFVNNSENSYHVVNGSGTDETTILDGFIITGGNADDPNFFEPGSYGGGMYNNSGSPTVTKCTFRENMANYGGGMHNGQSSPKVSNCTFSGNKANNSAGGMDNHKASPTVINCIFIANYGGAGGGGMYNYAGSPTVINCIFRGNSASEGGGMANNSSPTVINCTFTGNTAGQNGGGMANFVSSPMVTNCSFNGNTAYYRGGGMLNDYSGSPTLTNCILWGNTAVDGPQIALKRNSSVTISYCDMQGGQTAIDNDGTGSINWGTGNIDADPNFVRNADDGGDGWGMGDNDDFGDLHLQPGSPCIDAGNNNAVPSSVTTDLDGHPRIIDGDCNNTTVVDMGAYEFNWHGAGDFDNNCFINFFDFSISARYWMTDDSFVDIAPPGGDGIVDFREVAIIADNWLAGTMP